MKLIPVKLTLEDFKDQMSWIGPLFTIINEFTGDVFRGFTNQLTIEENLYQEIKEIKFKNTSSSFPLKFQTKFNIHPKGLNQIYLFDNTLNEISGLLPQVKWSFADNAVSISSITGLTANSTYSIRFLVYYG